MGKDQEFLDAARNGNLSVVEKILSQRAKRSGPLASLRRGPGANVQDNSGYTPLHHAALNGHKEVVTLLLAHDASTNIVDNKGSSPLHLAAWTGNLEIVKLILTQGALPTNVNLTVYETAVAGDIAEEIGKCLRNKIEKIEARKPGLMFLRDVNKVLQGESEKQLNAYSNHDRETPLHSAAQYGHTDVVSLLLQHNADPTVRNTRDETPLDLAGQYGRLETVELLVRTHPELLMGSAAATRTHSPLHLASRNGHRAVVQVLLRSGFDVNTRTDGGTALHEAALFGKVDVVRVLLDHGVNLETEDSRHRTVLDILEDLKTQISQEIAAIIHNHSSLISTSDDLQNANAPPSFGGKAKRSSGPNDLSPSYYNVLPGTGATPSPSDCYQTPPKPRLIEGDHRISGGSMDAYQVPPPPRSLESSMEESDMSMASSLYQTPPQAQELDDAMSIGSYYDPSREGKLPGLQRTSLPLEGEASMLYQVPPPPRESLKRMSDPVDSSGHAQGWYKGGGSTDMGMLPGGASYLPMAALQASNRGSLKPPQKPPRKNMSPHSPTKFQMHPGMTGSAYEYLCMASSGEYESGGGGSQYNDPKDSFLFRSHGGGGEYVDMKMRQSYAAYENSFPVYANSWDPPTDDRVYPYADGSPSGSVGSPYENVPPDSRFVPSLYAAATAASRSRESLGDAPRPKPPIPAGKPSKPNSLNLQGGARRNNGTATQEYPLSPTGYDQPPTPDFPPPSPGTAESGIHEKIRPLSQDSDVDETNEQKNELLVENKAENKIENTTEEEYKYKRRSRDIETLTEQEFFQALEGKASKSVSTENIEEVKEDRPFAGLYRGSTSLVSPNPNQSSEDTCDGDTPTMASTSDSEPQSTASTITNDRPRRSVSAAYENVVVDPTTVSQRVTLMSPAYENVALRGKPTLSTPERKESLSILSPFDENEEWAKIADIMASFGGGIARESVFAHELEEEFANRLLAELMQGSRLHLSPVGMWLSRLGVPEYENLLLVNGFDDLDFMGGTMLDDQELFEIGVMNAEHRSRMIEASKSLSAVTPLRTDDSAPPPDLTVDKWLESLHLEKYADTFRKHCYTDMERVLKMWEVELTTVLEITLLGHKKRILLSLGERPPLPHRYEDIEELNTNLKQLKTEINQLGIEMAANKDIGPNGTLRGKHASRKGPAPQPPSRPKSSVDTNGNKEGDDKAIDGYDTITIREPSQLFSGIPMSLTTQWRHKPEALINNCCNYTAQYLGSTLVRELKGVESTKKSIQKLKKSSSEMVKVPNIILSISHKGVKFIDAKAKNVVCEHEIRNIHCACQDADDLNHFAYITKDHQSNNHYCHVFSVTTMDLATEVILTLGQAFEVAYQMALKERSTKSGSHVAENGITRTAEKKRPGDGSKPGDDSTLVKSSKAQANHRITKMDTRQPITS